MLVTNLSSPSGPTNKLYFPVFLKEVMACDYVLTNEWNGHFHTELLKPLKLDSLHVPSTFLEGLGWKWQNHLLEGGLDPRTANWSCSTWTDIPFLNVKIKRSMLYHVYTTETVGFISHGSYCFSSLALYFLLVFSQWMLLYFHSLLFMCLFLNLSPQSY
jgi:hypothetical protein